jgi:FtsP/CotA-like multicopper oxidase with cupredoxin domain
MDKMEPMFRLSRGKRYRLHMLNATDDVHPIHLHRHSFELTNIAGAPMSGLIKDVAMIGAFQEISVDFTADQPGLSLFHCHMQHHMDFGFMALFDCR